MQEQDTPVKDAFEKGKAWYKSKTIIGLIVVAISTALGVFYPETDVKGAIDELMDADDIVGNVDSLWVLAGQAYGLILALYGRVKAKLAIK